ncbi:histidine kinase [Mesonia algae]|uniref:Histidine kinase n=1 Tax=Mesonia algae TaxID=213248 RepID=A0A2W7I914_9FLAO|nr:histidine kinase [Mesonia algae]PZW42628.1 histidine kinase [Mesonia algae]
MYRNKKITIFSHVFAWLVFLSMPYLLSYGQEQDINRIIGHFWIPIAFYAVNFYTNYFILIDKFLFANKIVLFIVINIALIALSVSLKEFFEYLFFEDTLKRSIKNKESGPPINMFIYVQMLSYMVPLLFSITIKTTKRWVKTESERKEAINFKLQSELQHLHYQLQPHFFFNSLNNIYALVDISPDQAKSSIHSLSKLMRYMLYDTSEETVSLSKEIDFMKKYIELMKLRVSDKTKITYTFPSEETEIRIAPLLFISLIENAFKHGVSANKESEINLQMSVEEKIVKFTIENNNLPKKTDDKSGSGIGLPNIEKRIALLYPDKSKFKTFVKEKRFIATLEIETT